MCAMGDWVLKAERCRGVDGLMVFYKVVSICESILKFFLFLIFLVVKGDDRLINHCGEL